MQHSPEIEAFIEEQKNLFWYIAPDKKKHISEEVLVEFVLNYGDLNSVKKLFTLMGVNHVAEVFRNQLSKSERIRGNYFPEYLYFFEKYFEKHAPQYS